jgi:hypothetical protein
MLNTLDTYVYIYLNIHRFLSICRFVISAIVENESTDKIDWYLIKQVYYYQPGGTSAKNLIHWLQILANEEVTYFDYGEHKNMLEYGQPSPPRYDLTKLSNFSIDMFITTSDGDPYCLKQDFEHMIEIFKNCKKTVKHLSKYNHLDYLWSPTASKDIYEHLVEFLNEI